MGKTHKVKVRVTGAGMTSLRKARSFVARKIADWVGSGEVEICMISSDPRVKCETRRGGSPTILISPAIQDAYPGMPVLPLIGYDRRTNA